MTIFDSIIFLHRYKKRSECFKKSYSSSHVRHGTYRGRLVQLAVDGENTFDENLCDIEALDIVSRQLWARTKKQQALPGVNYTKEQTFFINIAQVEMVIINILMKSHLPGVLRQHGHSQPRPVHPP